MDKFVVYGGKPLSGKVRISGAKNAVLPIMAASLLAPGSYRIRNAPHLRDTFTMLEVLRATGVTGEIEDNVLELDTTNCNNPFAPYELVKQMRASFYVLGPLLARFGEARVSLPGGCAWGPRPVDLHIKGMRLLGAEIELDKGYVVAKAKKLKGTLINLDITSVGATGNVMMAAVLADGETVIENAAREPEIVQLARFLKKMGAEIEGEGTGTIRIRGVGSLSPVDVDVIPDRIEAATFLLAGAMIGEGVIVEGLDVDHLTLFLSKLREAGVNFEVKSKSEVVISRPERLRAVNITTAPYPGFPTDMQAQWMAAMSIADGSSVILEEVYKDRFTHVPELIRLGADIVLDNNVAIVRGVKELQGAQVMSTDIRASASLILAGLVARGRTDIYRIYHIERGYERIDEKLRAIGAEIIREEAEVI
ncbi:MAG: UDP-N-acetylglucosamine 1-carboxyvinyltransferase [Candidatus Neomarinimicrobiota bacterium]|nr:UDP-N-acetylglucosamine 1-carboxyvinyltransferase [Candidatus Neomarinimicrobiota bacterium]RKY47631.1 MAG: UDP-N-acetylglucosamine 1-carboxyvinyltransferase [Candidatus Neomarinimicrobiota bacterium]RKY48922.1 MAG: UDP-N-acetylglucosamine 1-carboxyvinyltransferase [Candidatus Neomarinimicrobiota bacterium]